MFNWWSSLGPQASQGSENVSEKPAEGEQNTSVEACSGDGGTGKTDTQEKETSQDSKASELDYAKDMAKNVGNFLFSFASVASSTAYKVKDSVKETVEKQPIIGDFNRKQDEFVKEKHKRKEAAIPPWVGYNEEETMKNQILALSTDERNFLRDPPSGVPFHFESESMYPVALATLQEDKNLSKMRFKLVPKKISEERFWRNYFYRVSLIKQSTQLTSLAAAGASGSNGSDRQSTTSETKSDTVSGQSGTISIPRKNAETEETPEEDFSEPSVDEHSVHNEFISDSFAQTSQELSHDDLRQIGMEKIKQVGDQSHQSKPTEGVKQPAVSETQDDIPEWEKELQAELQDFEVVDNEESAEWEKEIEDMLEEENDIQ